MAKVNVEITPRHNDAMFTYQWVIWTDAAEKPDWYFVRDYREQDGGITQTLWGAKRQVKRAVKRLQKISKAGVRERTISYTVED